MNFKIIKTKKEYQTYLERVDELLDKKLSLASPESEELRIALLLIKRYEDAHFPIAYPDPRNGNNTP